MTTLWLIKELADRLGCGRFFSSDPREVFAELRLATAGGLADYAGISHERIDAEQGVFWPCPTEIIQGRHGSSQKSFPTSDGRASFIRVEYHEPDERPSPNYPYVLTTGRLIAQYQSGTQTRRVPSPSQTQVQPEAQLHPHLARRLNIGSADIVQLGTRRGAANFRATITPDIRPDVVFLPFHWGGASAANALTNPVLDPHSRMPAFKVCAVAMKRIGSPDDLHLLAAPPAARASEVIAAARAGAGDEARRMAAAATTSRFIHGDEQAAFAITRERGPNKGKDLPVITQNRFLQGIHPFEGAGLDKPVPISADLNYFVPDGVIGQALYFRGGNTTDELITVVLMRDGVPMRYFPIGARSDVHVPLRVVEDIEGGSVVELQLVAPLGLTGHLVADLGLVEH